MEKETREQKIQRLIEQHVGDRNMDPKSIKEHYNIIHFGIELDPDFFEYRLQMGWGFFKDEPRHLDHMTRQILIAALLTFRNRPGQYHQGKKGVMMGASYEQMMEAFEVASVTGGGPCLVDGMYALRRMKEEGVEPGCQKTPWTNKWVQLGPYKPGIRPEKEEDTKADVATTREERVERLLKMIGKYHPDEDGELNKDLSFGAKLDPDFFEGYAQLSWAFFNDKPRHLDPIRREMVRMLILAFQGRREDLYVHTKKAMRLGATTEQLLEAFEVGFTGGGSHVIMEGLRVLRRLNEEQTEPS